MYNPATVVTASAYNSIVWKLYEKPFSFSKAISFATYCMKCSFVPVYSNWIMIDVCLAGNTFVIN